MTKKGPKMTKNFIKDRKFRLKTQKIDLRSGFWTRKCTFMSFCYFFKKNTFFSLFYLRQKSDFFNFLIFATFLRIWATKGDFFEKWENGQKTLKNTKKHKKTLKNTFCTFLHFFVTFFFQKTRFYPKKGQKMAIFDPFFH